METINILLVEDNEGDIVLTQEALEETYLNLKLSVVRDGKEAIDFVSKQGKYTTADLPDLLLLDINLPKKNGLEVLQFIKGKESIKHIPVMILSTSSSEKDIDSCRKNFAHYYFIKPLQIGAFLFVINNINHFPDSSNFADFFAV
jgi:CheY-like chemotaxis protein